MSHKFALTTAMAIFPLAGAAASLAEIDTGLRGTYSSLCRHQESGDLPGTELSIVRPAEKLTVLYQLAEGVLGTPVLLTPASREGAAFVFRSTGNEIPAFSIEVKSKDEVVLRYLDKADASKAASQELLVRREPVWSGRQDIPDCR